MRIMVTGSTGYIASHIKFWFDGKKSDYITDCVSVRNGIPKCIENYDVVIHTAGLVHKSEKKYSYQDYYDINTNLTINIAKKAKQSGVKHFIFISTMAVYGLEGSLDKDVVITEKTVPNPTTKYGKSKLAAEFALRELESDDFKVSIIRPPMIYGKNCPGNYRMLKKLAVLTPIFPFVKNKRSILHINSLCQLIFLIVQNDKSGLYFPQDKTYGCTSKIVKRLSARKGKKIYLSKFLGKVIYLFDVSIIKKVFGNLVYSKKISMHFNNEYMLF